MWLNIDIFCVLAELHEIFLSVGAWTKVYINHQTLNQQDWQIYYKGGLKVVTAQKIQNLNPAIFDSWFWKKRAGRLPFGRRCADLLKTKSFYNKFHGDSGSRHGVSQHWWTPLQASDAASPCTQRSLWRRQFWKTYIISLRMKFSIGKHYLNDTMV